MTALGPVDFLITSEALEQMLDPDLDGIDGDDALEIFTEFEADIQRRRAAARSSERRIMR